MMNVEIDEIVTEMSVTDGLRGLSAQEKKELVQAVIECLRMKDHSEKQRDKDTSVRDRAYQPETTT